MTAGSRGGAPPLGGLGCGRPQGEGGREEGKGDGFGGGVILVKEMDFDGIMKKKVKEVMMKVMLEVEVVEMEEIL